MSKILNIIEASNMPVGTEFCVEFKDGFELPSGNIVVITESPCVFKWKNDDVDENVYAGKGFINAKFKVIQKEVSLKEAMEANMSGKAVRCEVTDKYGNFYSYSYKPTEGPIYQLRGYENNCGVSPLELLKGKWYIED